MPEQAPSRGAPRIRPTAVRRVAPAPEGQGFEGQGFEGQGFEVQGFEVQDFELQGFKRQDFKRQDLGLSGPIIVSLLLTGRNRPALQPPGDQEGGYRHIVGQ
jgi:hypothetical protein